MAAIRAHGALLQEGAMPALSRMNPLLQGGRPDLGSYEFEWRRG